jgi:hypothetical protein
MWIFTTDGFYSVVRKPGQRMLTVRSRVKGDLEKFFPKRLHKLIQYTPGVQADYLYRIAVKHRDFEAAMKRAMAKINYANFKDEVHVKDQRRMGYYTRVWWAMRQMQEQFDGKGGDYGSLFHEPHPRGCTCSECERPLPGDFLDALADEIEDEHPGVQINDLSWDHTR